MEFLTIFKLEYLVKPLKVVIITLEQHLKIKMRAFHSKSSPRDHSFDMLHVSIGRA